MRRACVCATVSAQCVWSVTHTWRSQWLYDRYNAYQKKQQEEYAEKRKIELGQCETDEVTLVYSSAFSPYYPDP